MLEESARVDKSPDKKIFSYTGLEESPEPLQNKDFIGKVIGTIGPFYVRINQEYFDNVKGSNKISGVFSTLTDYSCQQIIEEESKFEEKIVNAKAKLKEKGVIRAVGKKRDKLFIETSWDAFVAENGTMMYFHSEKSGKKRKRSRVSKDNEITLPVKNFEDGFYVTYSVRGNSKN